MEKTLDGTVVGDHYNTECPWCGKNNTYITDGVRLPFNTVKYFEKSCHHCGQTIVYQAKWFIKVEAAKKGGDDMINFVFGLINDKKSSN